MLGMTISGLVLGAALNAAAGTVTHVPDGDCAGLRSAVDAARPGQSATIVLARRGTYGCPLSVSHDNVLVDAAGATLTGDVCLSTLIDVAPGAELTLRNARVRRLDCGLVPPRSREIGNDGQLLLDSVTIEGDVRIENDATLTLRNVTAQASIANDGSLAVYQSTLLPVAIDMTDAASLTLANSILWLSAGSHTMPPACPASDRGIAHSLGGNLVGWGCSWATTADRVSAAYPDVGSFGDNGGLVPTYPLSKSSLLHGIGVARYCEPVDARGMERPAGSCDPGAFDSAGGALPVAAGGVSGAYFDAAADGHYIVLQRLEDDTVLVFWNTFDRNGAPAWIYGVGHETGKHIHAEMTQNVGGRLQPGGPASGSSPRSWGTLDIDLASCTAGTVHYASSLSAFGSGEFTLDRLAYVDDIGCRD